MRSDFERSWEQQEIARRRRHTPNHAKISWKIWRRRPDLNRGWRFCRQGRDVYLVDSSCFLVGPAPSFFPVFGRCCSQIVPKFLMAPRATSATLRAIAQRLPEPFSGREYCEYLIPFFNLPHLAYLLSLACDKRHELGRFWDSHLAQYRRSVKHGMYLVAPYHEMPRDFLPPSIHPALPEARCNAMNAWIARRDEVPHDHRVKLF